MSSQCMLIMENVVCDFKSDKHTNTTFKKTV